MVVGFTGYWHLLAHLINVCIKQNADSHSSLQQQQQQILYLLRHDSVQEFIA